MPHLINSLIAHYKMNDNAATAVVIDFSGNGHTGEYQLNNVAQNTSTGASVGKILGALDFVGGVNGEMIVVPDHANFSPGNSAPGTGTPFSISVWVYMHDATNFIIASKGVYNTDAEWQFYVGGTDKVIIRFYDESVDNCYIGRRHNTALTPYENQWIHLVATFDGTTGNTQRIYLNGVRIDNATAQQNGGSFVAIENDLGHDVWIGRYDTTYANGLIDNLMFFNKELTLLDTKYLYNGGMGRENISIGIQLSRTGHRFLSFPEN